LSTPYSGSRRLNPDLYRLHSSVKAKKHTSGFEHLTGLSFKEFNEKIGLPRKNNLQMPIFDYEWQVVDSLERFRRIWVKKATGLGITELMLRYMAWICTRDDFLNVCKMCIVRGHNIVLAFG